MDSKTILFNHRRRRIKDLAAKAKGGNITEFRQRDEYGRFHGSPAEEEPGVGGTMAGSALGVGALVGGLYARGRIRGTLPQSRLEAAAVAGYGRARDAVRGAASRASLVGREGVRSAKSARTGMANALAGRDIYTGGNAPLSQRLGRAGRIGRGNLRSFLTRTSRGLARLR